MSENDVVTACIPCAIGHFSTSAKLLNEAVRFKKEGLTSKQILDDIAASIGEQNALERIDLTPEKIQKLEDWERNLAEEALDKSRDLRHKLESIQSIEDLENLAADTETFYKKLNRDWNQKRLEECPTCVIKSRMKEEEEEEKEKEKKSEVKPVGSEVAEKRRQFIEQIRRELLPE